MRKQEAKTKIGPQVDKFFFHPHILFLHFIPMQNFLFYPSVKYEKTKLVFISPILYFSQFEKS